VGPNQTVIGVLASRPAGYPTVDFYGNPIPASNADAGAVQSAPEVSEYTWNGSQNNNDWENPLNWDPNGIPTKATDVIIPANSEVTNYPILTTDAYADNIRFGSGAEVGAIQYLHYFSSEVEFNLTDEGIDRGRYYTIGAPLKDMVVGDFSFGGSPSAYAKYAKNITSTLAGKDGVTIAEYADFTDDLPDYDVPLPLGFGFAWKVASGGYAKTLTFPYFMTQPATNHAETLAQTPNKHHQYEPAAELEAHHGTSKFFYFYTNGGRAPEGTYPPAQVTRQKTNITINSETKTVPIGMRFIPENENNVIPAEFDIDLTSNGLLVANPFLSHLNFAGLFTGGTNDAKIEKYYRLWNGSAYSTVALTPATLTGVTVTNYAQTEADGETGDLLISPLQSFLVKPKASQDRLTIKVAVVSTAPTTGGGALRSATAGSIESLKVIAKSAAGGSAVVIQRGEDPEAYGVSKLFTFVQEVPELYIMQDQPLEIALMDKDQASVALGVRAPEGANITLSFGLNSLTGETVSLYDDQTQSTIDLSATNNTYSFTNNTNNMSNRFFLLFAPATPTGLNDRIADIPVSVSTKDNTIRIVSSPLNLIRSIKVYSAQGQLITEQTRLSAVASEVQVTDKGAFFVEVNTEQGRSIKKVINY
jgi:hypothetical protein